MVAACGYYRLAQGYADGLDMDVSPDLKLISHENREK
jgi:hypothetical protein